MNDPYSASTTIITYVSGASLVLEFAQLCYQGKQRLEASYEGRGKPKRIVRLLDLWTEVQSAVTALRDNPTVHLLEPDTLLRLIFKMKIIDDSVYVIIDMQSNSGLWDKCFGPWAGHAVETRRAMRELSWLKEAVLSTTAKVHLLEKMSHSLDIKPKPGFSVVARPAETRPSSLFGASRSTLNLPRDNGVQLTAEELPDAMQQLKDDNTKDFLVLLEIARKRDRNLFKDEEVKAEVVKVVAPLQPAAPPPSPPSQPQPQPQRAASAEQTGEEIELDEFPMPKSNVFSLSLQPPANDGLPKDNSFVL
ncbi:hypothetical protein EXIGLDRAFT_746157, partial [Exidia glandulosa HHB12029]